MIIIAQTFLIQTPQEDGWLAAGPHLNWSYRKIACVTMRVDVQFITYADDLASIFLQLCVTLQPIQVANTMGMIQHPGQENPLVSNDICTEEPRKSPVKIPPERYMFFCISPPPVDLEGISQLDIHTVVWVDNIFPTKPKTQGKPCRTLIDIKWTGPRWWYGELVENAITSSQSNTIHNWTRYNCRVTHNRDINFIEDWMKFAGVKVNDTVCWIAGR